MSFRRGRRVAEWRVWISLRGERPRHPLGRCASQRACIVFNLCERTQLYDRIVMYAAGPVA